MPHFITSVEDVAATLTPHSSTTEPGHPPQPVVSHVWDTLPPEYIKARTDVGWILSHSEKTVTETVRALTKKGHSPEVIQDTIEWAQQYNYLNDARYVAMYLREYVLKQGRTYSWAVYKLSGKGIEPELVREVNETHECVFTDVETETDRALSVGRRFHTKAQRDPDQTRARKRFYHAMARQGYSYSTARHVWDTLEGQ